MSLFPISKKFFYSFICAGVLKGITTSSHLKSRLLPLSTIFFFAVLSLLVKISSSQFSALLLTLNLNTKIPEILIRSLMLSISATLLITFISRSYEYTQKIIAKCLLFFVAFLFVFPSLYFFVISIKDYYFWLSFIFAGLFFSIIAIYSVESYYDLNDTWYDNYSQTQQNIWAIYLIVSSVLCWLVNLFFLYESYSSGYFYYILTYFLSSLVLAGLSSSPICENGCNFYLALLSCSMAVTLGMYFLGSTLVFRSESEDLKFVFIDILISSSTMLYIALSYQEDFKTENTQVNITELKIFKEGEESKVEENETAKVKKNFEFRFQVFLICFALYIGMITTEWECQIRLNIRVTAGVAQSFSLFLFYVWSLVVPIVFPERV